MWQQFQNNDAEDEHNQPTEPMPRFVLSSGIPTVAADDTTSANETIPAPQPKEQPFPQQVPVIPPMPPVPQQPPYSSPQPAAYPYLPPAPIAHNGPRPAGGSPNQPGPPGQTVTGGAAQKQQRTRSRIPALVGLCFVVVQCVLLLRFGLKLLNASTSTAWIGTVYSISSLFIAPFQQLVQQVPLRLPSTIELYTLVAILVYGIISRMLVRLLKAIMNPR